MKSLTRILFALVALAPCANVATAQITGDESALKLADQIVESIGGREVWRSIRSLHVFENSRSVNGAGIIGEFWRDLEAPRERYTLRNRQGMAVEFWWDERGVYRRVNGELQDVADTLHDEVKAYWPGEIYVMYRRFAVDDSDLQLKTEDERSFSAYSRSGDELLGRFWVNGDGDLYRWRHADGTEYIYGPHRSFGAISFPEWGTQVDGSWSFSYIDVRGLPGPPPTSFDPPAEG